MMGSIADVVGKYSGHTGGGSGQKHACGSRGGGRHSRSGRGDGMVVGAFICCYQYRRILCTSLNLHVGRVFWL